MINVEKISPVFLGVRLRVLSHFNASFIESSCRQLLLGLTSVQSSDRDCLQSLGLWLGFHLDASDKLSWIPTLHDNQIVCKTTAHKVLAIFALMIGVSARVSPVAKRAPGPVLRA